MLLLLTYSTKESENLEKTPSGQAIKSILMPVTSKHSDGMIMLRSSLHGLRNTVHHAAGVKALSCKEAKCEHNPETPA